MIAGFSAINGHISGQCRGLGSSSGPGSGGLLAAPQIATQTPQETGLTPDLCLHLQGQHFNGHPHVCAVASGLTHYIKHTPPPPPPPPQTLLPPPPPPPAPPQLRVAPTLPLLQAPPVPTAVAAAAAPKPGQGGFKKVCRTEEAAPCPFPGLPAGVLHMRVKEGSKIRNLMGFAMARMQGSSDGTGSSASVSAGSTGSAGSSGSVSVGLRQVVFSGSGRAVTKTITCAEIMKRKLGGLHQMTKLCYRGVREVWESQELGNNTGAGTGDASGNSVTTAATSEMTVHRTVPSISILLSKDPLDPREPGYQPPETLSVLWGEREREEQGGGGGGGLPQTSSKRSMQEPLLQGAQPSSKRLCVGTAGSLGCPPPDG